MFCQIFLSPQVKRCAIITYKYGIHEMLHELPIDLRLGIFADGWEKKDLENYEISANGLNPIEW